MNILTKTRLAVDARSNEPDPLVINIYGNYVAASLSKEEAIPAEPARCIQNGQSGV
jgi:hypothetical protein